MIDAMILAFKMLVGVAMISGLTVGAFTIYAWGYNHGHAANVDKILDTRDQLHLVLGHADPPPPFRQVIPLFDQDQQGRGA